MRSHTGPSDPGTVRYLLADHLGSSTAVLDGGGTLIESAKYYPYGSLRSGGLTVTDKEFTGQQHEGTAFGVYNYGARFYSAVLGRFLSADPIMREPGDPQATASQRHSDRQGERPAPRNRPASAEATRRTTGGRDWAPGTS